MDVVGAAQGEADRPGPDRRLAHLVDQDEDGDLAVFHIGGEGDVRAQGQVTDADVVQLQRPRGQRLRGVDIHLVPDVGDRGGDGARTQLQIVLAAGQQRRTGCRRATG